MAFETEQVVDQTTVSETGVVGYRTVTRLYETMQGGGRQQIGDQLFSRTTLTPGQDIPDGTPASVAAICQAAWTPEVIAAYEALHA